MVAATQEINTAPKESDRKGVDRKLPTELADALRNLTRVFTVDADQEIITLVVPPGQERQKS